MVTYGADIELKDQNGFTPLMQACLSHHWAAANALIDCGADVNVVADASSTTPLQMTDPKGRAMLVKALLAADANPNVKAPQTLSILAYACQCGASEAALALIDAGADLELELEQGPLTFACEQGMLEVIEKMRATAQKVRPFQGVSAHDLMTAYRSGQHPAKRILEAQDAWRLAA